MKTIDDIIVHEPSPWMTIHEAAKYHQVTTHTIHDWCRKGMLKKHRVPGYRIVRLKRVEVEGLFK